jgi:hypothetical protein
MMKKRTAEEAAESLSGGFLRSKLSKRENAEVESLGEFLRKSYNKG